MKIYLDTSIISAYFDSGNPERQELTQDFFTQIGDYDPCISELTRIEIDQTLDAILKGKMKTLINSSAILPSTPEISLLSEKYIEAGAITSRLRDHNKPEPAVNAPSPELHINGNHDITDVDIVILILAI